MGMAERRLARCGGSAGLPSARTRPSRTIGDREGARAHGHHNGRLSTSWRNVISHSPRGIPCFDGSVVIRRVAPFSAVKAMRLAGHFDIDIELRRGTLGAGYNHVFGDFRGPPQ